MGECCETKKRPRASQRPQWCWNVDDISENGLNNTVAFLYVQGVSEVDDNIKKAVHQTLYMCVMMIAYLFGDLLLMYEKLNFSF